MPTKLLLPLLAGMAMVGQAQANDLFFYEGNNCTQSRLFSYDTRRFANDNCQNSGACDGNNDEARSVLVMPGAKARARIQVFDDPKASSADDFTIIEITNPQQIPAAGYCVGSFERDTRAHGVLVEHGHHNGLDGKISRVRVLPNPGDRIGP